MISPWGPAHRERFNPCKHTENRSSASCCSTRVQSPWNDQQHDCHRHSLARSGTPQPGPHSQSPPPLGFRVSCCRSRGRDAGGCTSHSARRRPPHTIAFVFAGFFSCMSKAFRNQPGFWVPNALLNRIFFALSSFTFSLQLGTPGWRATVPSRAPLAYKD
jgi:hypothetical protein